MLAEAGAPPAERRSPGAVALAAIPAGFAILGLVLRLLAYLQAGWEPHLAGYPDGLCRWDCQWYVILATSGYDPFPVPRSIDAGNWAFFPLFPMLVGAVHRVLPGSVMMVATGVSILMSMAAALVAWPLLGRNLRAYTLYCAFLLCGPFSIYFTSFFTEVLFVLLANGVLLALRRSQYLAAGTLAGLLSATRIVGVFMVFALVLHYLIDYRRRAGTLRRLPQHLWQQPAIVLATLLTPLGLFSYMAFLHFQIGDALAFNHVQRAWGRVTGNPLVYLSSGLTDWPPGGLWLSTNQWLALSTLGGLAITALLALRRQYPAALFCLLCIVVPLSAGMASMLRFIVALSPLVLVAMGWLATSRVIWAMALLAFIVGDYAFTVGWLKEWLTLV
jgi:hypothetical protein